MGADAVLLGLADRPAFMHALIHRLCDAYLAGLRQFEALGLISRNDTNVRIGSGGYGYTNDLRGALPNALPDDGDALRPGGRSKAEKPINLWGAATPQIFGSVSPGMHREFGLEYERRWLEQFGLAYYGCCEPLHNKISILESLPNLRKISISPWQTWRPPRS